MTGDLGGRYGAGWIRSEVVDAAIFVAWKSSSRRGAHGSGGSSKGEEDCVGFRSPAQFEKKSAAVPEKSGCAISEDENTNKHIVELIKLEATMQDPEEKEQMAEVKMVAYTSGRCPILRTTAWKQPVLVGAESASGGGSGR
jgi:hypothetical protein